MVWKAGKSDRQISEMNPGDHVAGDIGMLGWAVVKAYEVGKEDIVSFVMEKHAIGAHFLKYKNKWSNIQPKIKNMQFPDLVKIPPTEEELLQKFPGNRFMRFSNLAETNPELKKQYPQLDKCFDENLLLCDAYMSRVCNITCKYVFQLAMFWETCMVWVNRICIYTTI